MAKHGSASPRKQESRTLDANLKRRARRLATDPGFVWQSNLLLVVVGLLLIAGIWGLTQRRLRTTLSGLAVNRG